MSRRNRLRTSTVIGVAALVALAAFGLGFVASYEPAPQVETAGPATATTTEPPAQPTTTEAAGPSTTDTTAPTSAPDTLAPTTAPSSTVPMTAAPTTVTPLPTIPSTPLTTPLPTAPATLVPVPTTSLASPGRLEATYPRDSQGRMTLVAGGSSAVILQNTGGSPTSFTVSGSGAVTVGATGTASGLLAPGEIRSVPVIASQTAPDGPGPHATISVFGASGLVVAIPVLIV